MVATKQPTYRFYFAIISSLLTGPLGSEATGILCLRIYGLAGAGGIIASAGNWPPPYC